MTKNRIFIGRNEDSDIVVPSIFNVVSGSHADIKLLEDGKYLYSDHSTNGSTVLGKTIRNEAVAVEFGTPIILATRYALDWEKVRELLPPIASQPNAAAQQSNAAAHQQPIPPESVETQLRGVQTPAPAPRQSANDWKPSHPSDFTSPGPQGPQPSYNRSSRVSGGPTANGSKSSRVSGGPTIGIDRETRVSSVPNIPGGYHPSAGRSSDPGTGARDLDLKPGDLFGGRFLLTSSIGRGASATVWEAQDTKAGGLKVAIKIFSQMRGVDSYGLQNLQKEFTTVFDLTSQYLLTPSYYDVCQGRPYLVMRYCPQGSAAKLIGNASEAQVIKMLHDVAAGLEYLHEKNIIHQDIKPDNILIADNGDFMITDFGISATIDALSSDSEISGGTQAYMGPERFAGKNVSASDIWSLGATAYELVTGDAPYGDHGGIMQTYGNTVPPIKQKLQPEVRDIIMQCLERDPAKRPTAAEIRSKIDIYFETNGKWHRPSKAKTTLITVGILLALLLAGGGYWAWNYLRVKSSYYAEVTEAWGVPKGVGKKVDYKKRRESIMIQTQRGKVIRVANVNSAGKVVAFNDSEGKLRHNPDTRYVEWAKDGTPSLLKVYDEHGKPMYNIVMDVNKQAHTGSASFARIDNRNNRIMLPADINQSYKESTAYTDYSTINKYDYKYDDNGYVTSIKYRQLDNKPTVDKYGIGGINYTRDKDGLITSLQYVDIDGEPAIDANGLSVREYEYDGANLIECRYTNAQGGPAHDGSHVPVVRYEYDKDGNVIRQSHYGLDGDPVGAMTTGISSVAYEYSGGNRVKTTYYDVDGKPLSSAEGMHGLKYEYNNDGFEVCRIVIDSNGNPLTAHDRYFTKIVTKPNDVGQPLEMRYYDQNDRPCEDADGIFLTKFEYDDNSNMTSVSFFDKNEKAIEYQGLWHERKLQYNPETNDCVTEAYFDKNGDPATCDGVVSILKKEYNGYGAIEKIRFLGKDGNPTRGQSLVAGSDFEYDPSSGKSIRQTYVDVDGKPSNCFDSNNHLSYSTIEIENGPNGVKRQTYSNVDGDVVATVYFTRDLRGNITSKKVIMHGVKPEYVENFKYDDNNHVLEEWYTTIGGGKTTCDDGYHKIKHKYNDLGYLVETSYHSINDRPVEGINIGIHKIVYGYDEFGRKEAEYYFTASGGTLSGLAAYKYEYDEDGNVRSYSYRDKNNKLSKSDIICYALRNCNYDSHGNLIEEAYLDANRRPVEYEGSTKILTSYNPRQQVTKQEYFNKKGKYKISVSKYNPQGSLTTAYNTTPDGKSYVDDYKLIVEYEKDGVTPKKLTLKAVSPGVKSQYYVWDDEEKEWNEQ